MVGVGQVLKQDRLKDLEKFLLENDDELLALITKRGSSGQISLDN